MVIHNYMQYIYVSSLPSLFSFIASIRLFARLPVRLLILVHRSWVHILLFQKTISQNGKKNHNQLHSGRVLCAAKASLVRLPSSFPVTEDTNGGFRLRRCLLGLFREAVSSIDLLPFHLSRVHGPTIDRGI